MKLSFLRRPRLRFSLRVLFVAITVFAVWFGWQVVTVRERRALLRKLTDVSAENYKPFRTYVYGKGQKQSISIEGPSIPDAAPNISWIRKLLGDRGFQLICLPASMSSDDVSEYRKAFPESHVTQLPTGVTKLGVP
jgi:hypothetical protein